MRGMRRQEILLNMHEMEALSSAVLKEPSASKRFRVRKPYRPSSRYIPKPLNNSTDERFHFRPCCQQTMPILSIEVDQFYTQKRTRKKALRGAKIAQKHGVYSELSTRFGRTSRVLDRLSKAALLPLKPHRTTIKVKIPSVFSIIDNPEGSVALILGFAAGIRQSSKKIREIVFDHSDMTSCDLAANSVLDIVAVEFEAERKTRGARIPKARGFFPKDKALARLIRGVGIIKHLDVKHEAPKPKEAERLEILDARNHNYESASGKVSDRKSKATKQFVDHINKCLKRTGRELSEAGVVQLVGYVGEILSNAEDHAEFIDWTVQGYLDCSLEVPTCEIAIFNFGRSIAESISSVDRSGYTWKTHIEPYLDAHESKRFFGTNWRREDLLTIIALQAHVSRKNESATTLRGQGTVDLIKFFQQVYKECNGHGGSLARAKMAIVSGGTYVLFDGNYEMKQTENSGMVVAFNRENSLLEKPDTRYVKPLGDWNFPGTIISIKFPLSLTNGSLVEVIEDERTDNVH